jgi:hypothetical protein
MKKIVFILSVLTIVLLSGCSIDPYKKGKYGEMVIDYWYNDSILGETRKKAENMDEMLSRKCTFLESKDNKYVFSCEIVYKEKGETVIPLSKNTTIKVYAVFIKENHKYNYKVYNSKSEKNVWKNDKELNY